MSSVAHLTWEKGGHADVVKIEGENIVLRSTTSAPPGARLSSTLTSEPRTVVKVKSYGTHRESDGSFTLKGRLIDATRELRQHLATLAEGAASPGGSASTPRPTSESESASEPER